jgi:hypothetical protein
MLEACKECICVNCNDTTCKGESCIDCDSKPVLDCIYWVEEC